MLPIDLPPPPFDFSRDRPPPPIISAWGGVPFSAAPAFQVNGVNPSVAPWLRDNVDYYRMQEPYETTWYGQGEPYNARGYYYPVPVAVPTPPRPLALLWDKSLPSTMHEATHAYVDNYGRIWPAASRPAGESQEMNFRGQFLGAVKQLSIDPQHANTPAGNWARWFVTHPEIPESEMYAVFATEAGNVKGLPPYLQSFYRGLFTNESVEGMRKAS